MYSSSLAMNSPKNGTGRLLQSPSHTARPSTPRKTTSEEADFMIGDRVLVGGKPGIIAYLGDVKFAAGDFAGVVLDEAVGKNDGAMKGTRYFQCDPMRGVFVRASKLVRNSAAVMSPTRASPKSNNSHTLSTSSRPSPVRSKSSSSSSSAPPSATEDKSFSPVLDAACSSIECQKKTGKQIEKIQKEYEGLITGTRDKLEEFQTHIAKLEKDNDELHKTIDEQKAKIEDLQFQLEEEVLSKEDIMQELVDSKNNNDEKTSTIGGNNDVKVVELQQQLDESVAANSSLREELDQLKSQLSDIEFQLAENESEKDNEIKEKRKMERLIEKLKSQSASEAAPPNQSDNDHSSHTLSLLHQQLADKSSQLKASQRNYSKLEQKVTLLQEKISSLESQHSKDKLVYIQTTNNTLEQHKIDIDILKEDHSKELHRLREEHRENINNMRKEYDASVHQLEVQSSDQLTSLQHQLQKLQKDYTSLSKAKAACIKCTSLTDQLENIRKHSKEVETCKDKQIQKLSKQVKNLSAEKEKLSSVIDSKCQLSERLKQQVSDTQHRLKTWQQDVQSQVEASKLQSEKDLSELKTELESSQTLLGQLKRKLSLSETENSKLTSSVSFLSGELHQAKEAMLVASPRGLGNDGTYRDTSDFLFNELKHQVEVMEVNMQKVHEEEHKLRDENDKLRQELSQVRHELCSWRDSRRSSLPRTFCDTCGTFDQHATSQCLRRRSSSLTPQSNPIYSLSRQSRCSICSVLGHWTADCTVDE
ncbi:CAP-Gly domain-containing linker protein 1-like [Watersipora subatra]|uniref:CAP-Gly domain-containing linker protein 1-like n=1 Tax=Watersipora subatra TaxID=2589382 RepID=UPI00355B3899